MTAQVLARALLSALALAAGPDPGATYEGSTSSMLTGFQPERPVAGQPFLATVLSGRCENLGENPSDASVISLQGGVLAMRIPGVPDWSCNEARVPRQYVLPALAAGRYRVDLELYSIAFPGDVGKPVGYIGGMDVEIVAATPLPIPASGSLSTLIAALAMLAVGIASVRTARYGTWQ